AMTQIVVFAFNGITRGLAGGLLVLVFERGCETGSDVFQRDAAFRTLRTGHRRNDVAHVEFENVGEDRIGCTLFTPHALRAAIGFDQFDAMLVAAGGVHVVERSAAYGEEAAGRAIFRAHIGDRGAVGQRHVCEAFAEEFDEPADDALPAQHLRAADHEVGRGHAFLDLAGQAEADDFRQQHGNRLAEHGRFSFDAADAPAQNAKAVDHGGVAVGADAGIGIGNGRAVFFLGPDGLRQIFKVHLMADAGAGRNDAEVLECLLAPLEEAVAFAVALIFEVHIGLECAWIAEFVDDDRVVDDQINGHQRIDLFRIAAERLDAVAHGCKVNDGGNAGEVLHQHARRAIGDFRARGTAVVQPLGNSFDVRLLDGAVVLEAEQVLKQNLHGEWKLGNAFEAVLFGFGQAVIDVILAPDGEGLAAFKAVDVRHCVRPYAAGRKTRTNA